MRKIRFLLRFLRAFVKKHKRLILIGFLIGILVFILLPKLTTIIFRKKEVLKIGMVGHYSLAEIPLPIQEKISQGLTTISEDKRPKPALSSDWEENKEATNYIFHLRDDIYWHDGTKLVAEDINYNFRDVEMEILDSKTIQFKLKESFSPFPVVASRPVFKKGFIGTGKYRVKKITQKGQFIESILLKTKDSKKPDLYYRFYPSQEAAKTAFKLGEVNILEKLLNLDDLRTWPDIKISASLNKNQYVAIFFNMEDRFLQEKTFRQALAYAIEKRKEPERALGPLSPLSWAYNSEVKPYNKDIAHAKTLLDKGLEGKNLQEISLTISTAPSLLAEAEKIKKEWEALGFKVNIKGYSPGEGFQVLLAIQEIPPDPDQYSLWHSTQEGNITRLNSPRIDKLLEDGRKTSDHKERLEIYYDFQRFLVEEVPVVFLYHPTTYQVKRD